MMGITSLQVCMDTSDDWLQGTIPEDQSTEMDSSAAITPISYSEEEIVICSRPLIERRLRPQQEQSQKCPRCESTHTKFCYYNNYSLSQPRFFCKTCRRYWTKGGTLRNIPVGGGCRKNKKTSSNSKKSPPPPNDIHHNQSSPSLNLHPQEIPDLHLAFPEQIRFPSHFNNFETGPFSIHGENPSYLIENPTPINFMETKYDSLLRISHDFLGINNNGGLTENNYGINCSAFGMSSLEGNYGNSSPTAKPGLTILESSQNLMLPNYENFQHLNQNQEGNVKPSSKILSIEWNDHLQACNSDAGIGSWTGLMNGFGASATDYSLV